MKRHERPFMCTNWRCFHKAGSRDDCERHEKAQHGIPEGWLCTVEVPGEKKHCYTYFDVRNRFEEHLMKIHGAADTTTNDMVEEMHLGLQGQRRFWCGFCNAVIPNPGQEQGKKAAEQAWKRRVAHVSKHLSESEGFSGDDWVCVFMQKKKKDITPQERHDLHHGKLRPGTHEPFDFQLAFERSQAREKEISRQRRLRSEQANP